MMVRDLYIETMEKINKLVFAFWKTPRSVLVGQDWQRFTGDEVRGDYLYELSLSAKRDVSKAERKVEALMMLGQLMPLFQAGMPPQIMEYLTNAANDPAFEMLLKSMKGGGRGAQQGAQNASV
jgi:hypothetical protein